MIFIINTRMYAIDYIFLLISHKLIRHNYKDIDFGIKIDLLRSLICNYVTWQLWYVVKTYKYPSISIIFFNIKTQHCWTIWSIKYNLQKKSYEIVTVNGMRKAFELYRSHYYKWVGHVWNATFQSKVVFYFFGLLLHKPVFKIYILSSIVISAINIYSMDGIKLG